MYHLNHYLNRLDYPVDVLTVKNARNILDRFCSHSLRMLIVGELCGALLETHLSFLARNIDVVFVDQDAIIDNDWIFRTFTGTEKIVYL